MRIVPMTAGVALAIMLGWLLAIGGQILVPLIAALISLYLLAAVADALGKLPLMRWSPLWLRRIIALAGFAALLVTLSSLIVASFADVLASLPGYQDNLDQLLARLSAAFGLAGETSWVHLRAVTLEQIDLRALVASIASSMGSFGGQLFLIILYASFLVVEQHTFLDKLALAVPDHDRRERIVSLVATMNDRVGNYLVVKTLVNIILGVVSYVVMWLIGIEFAVFWAVLIGFLNYIPYVGSLFGVLFPVLLSLAQFGSLSIVALSLVTLTAVQMLVGNVLEPRMMSRAFNLSPFVVLASLAFWSALWGMPGAILAVPMTAVLLIVLAEIEATRPIAVMLSVSGRI